MADDVSQKANELKSAAESKVEQGKAIGAQIADQVSIKAVEIKDSATNATTTIIETAIHAKDVTIEKVQEISHTVSLTTIFILCNRI